PLLKLELQAAAPFTVVAHVVVQFHRTKLAEGAPPVKMTPPTRLGSKEFMDDGWPNDKARAWFTDWMKQHNLIRHGENDADFAFRVLKFMQGHFRYVIPDNIPEHRTMVEKNPEMGDWHYIMKTWSGECYRISETYCRVMRMNGIPARLVSGNFITEQDGHHLRSLIYLENTGWVPVEATSAVSSPKDPALNFFGSWGGPMLVGNKNVGFKLQGPKDQTEIGTLDQIAFGSDDGKWNFPPAEIQATVLPAKK
ncbi:MAG TPA: transglutaminase-like domain-containing protein, partial [Verrucomicrobiaceae bacterium]